MNAYTLEPLKAESTAATAPTFAPVPIPAPALPSIYAPPSYQHYSQQYPQPFNVQPDTRKIRDWLAWSIISLFVGGIIPGFLPLVFTLICRSNKKYNEINCARTMSTLALAFNIIITIIAVIASVALFIYFFVYNRMLTMDY